MFRTVNVSLFVVSLFISLCNAAPDIDDFTDFEKNEVQFNSVDGIFGQEFDFFDENGVSLLDFGDATDNIQQGSEISLREEPREIPEIWSWCKDPPTAFKVSLCSLVGCRVEWENSTTLLVRGMFRARRQITAHPSICKRP